MEIKIRILIILVAFSLSLLQSCANSSEATSSDPDTTIFESIGPICPPPLQAAAAGYTYLAFREEFSSTSGIDMNDSGQPGYNFYRRRPFGYPVTPNSGISVADGVLILTSIKRGANDGLYTVCRPNGWAANTYTGFAVRDGAYFEARISFDPKPTASLPPGQSYGWPAFWSMAAEHLYGNATEAIECDFFDKYTNQTGSNPTGPYDRYLGGLHRWEASSTSTIVNWSTLFIDVPGVNWTTWNIPGTLWKAGTKGTIDFYFNNVLKTQNPLPGSPWELGNNQTWPVILGSDNWPMKVDWVRVWTKPPLEHNAVYEIAPYHQQDSRLTSGGTGNNYVSIQNDLGSGTNLAQRWKAVYMGNGYYEFVPQNETTKSLTALGTSNGRYVIQSSVTESTAHYWRVIMGTPFDGVVELEPVSAFRHRLEVTDSGGPGAGVDIRQDQDAPNQRWIMHKQ